MSTQVGQTARAPSRGRGRSPWSALIEHDAFPVIVSLAAVAVAFQLQSHFFLTATNLNNLAIQVTPLVALALAEVTVILMKEIDLSLGSVAGLSASIGGALMTKHGWAFVPAVAAMLGAGAGMGAVQGFVVVFGRVPSFIVTLGGYLAWLGLQLQVLGAGGNISVANGSTNALTLNNVATVPAFGVVGVIWLVWTVDLFRRRRPGQPRTERLLLGGAQAAIAAAAIGGGVAIFSSGGGVPLCFVLVTGIVAAAAIGLKHMPSGRHLYAVGGNPEAARRVGVKVWKVRWAGFIVAGMLAAVAGLLFMSEEEGVGTLTGGGTILLEAIGAAVVGGVSLFGGRGSAWGALVGALVLAGVDNGLDLTQHSDSTKYVVQGMVVVFAVMVDSAIRNRKTATPIGVPRIRPRRR